MLKFKKEKTRDFIFYIGLLALPLLQFSIFYVGVNFNSILLAFKKIDPLSGAEGWVGFDNFKRVFQDWQGMPLFSYAFKNSFIVYLCSLLVGISLAVLFSYYIYKKMPTSSFFRILLFMPSIVSPMVLATLFLQFAERGVPTFLKLLTGEMPLGMFSNPDTTMVTLIFYTIFFGFGTSTLLYVGAMGNISESIVEAARMDGCGVLRELFSITLPLIYPTLIVFITTGIAGVFTNQMSLFSFYGAKAQHKYYTVGYYLYVNSMSLSNIFNYPYLAAMGIVITAIVAPITLALHRTLSRFDPTER
jgi:ABC-type sugar transport system permease subunit